MMFEKKPDKENIFWWSPRAFLGLPWLVKENAGDYLGPLLVEKILKTKGLDTQDINNKRLLSIGSIFHFARDNDIIWGTGINGKIPLDQLTFTKLDIRSVRGPLTAKILRQKGLKVPEVFGDPGILTSIFWPRDEIEKETNIIYIPHMREKVKNNIKENYKVVTPRCSVDNFIKEIQKASKVLTTSLHGVIIAESYGIPAVLMENFSGETDFKYDDYYSGTGRKTPPIFKNVEDAAMYNPSIPDLSYYQDRLLEAFPFDEYSASSTK